MRALILVLVLTTACSSAQRRWRTTDTVLQGTVTATLVADYLQTRQIVRDGLEVNPIIGQCGGHVRMDKECSGLGMPPELYFGAVAVAHYGLMRVLPRTVRNIAQGATIAVQLETVHHNFSAGYGFSF